MSLPIGTLTDTGPLFALIDPGGQPEQNMRCTALLATLSLPLMTTWPCLTEAMHLAGRAGGWRMQQVLGRLLASDTLRLHPYHDLQAVRILALMHQYQDRPMDLADASLIALAEAENYSRIFSLDGDFYIYRLAGGGALEVLPGPLPRLSHP